MHTQNAAATQQYDLRGWRSHFIFDAEKLNALCLHYYEGRPDTVHTDAVDFVHQRPSGWLTTRCVLGSPLPEFPTGNGETITVARRFVSYTSYEFHREQGARYADILEIVAGSRNERRALFQTFRLDQCVGTYQYNDDTIFTLSAGSDFSVGFLGFPERDTDAGLPFKIRFDKLPAGEKIVVLPKTADVTFGKWLMQDIRFYLRRTPDQYSHVMYIANASDGNGSIPASMEDEREQGPATALNALGYCFVHWDDIPDEGFYGRDFEEFSQLLFPVGRAAYYGFEEDYPVSTVTLLEPSTGFETPTPDAAVYSSHIDPLVRIVSAGSAGQRLVLNTVNPATPIWQFTSPAVGQLVPDGRFCDYIPQDEGGVIYEKNPLTGKDAALRTSMTRDPVDIVRILSGFALLPYFSTMVVLNARPTHYFKLAAVGVKLQLTLVYEKWGEGETVVPPELIDWKVLAGDGNVSNGLFSSGTTNRFSVVQAIHRDPKWMQFAVIIIPMPLLTAAQFVAMRNGG